MTTRARLSFWVHPEPLDAFAAAYEQQLVPLLKKHSLVESSEPGRQTVDGVFSRLFEVESPAAVATEEQALHKDPKWQELLASLSATFGGSAPLLSCHFRLYRAPAGPGKTVEAGSGFRQGVWQSFGVQDSFPVDITYDILQDRQGYLWFATHHSGVCRYDGAQVTTFTTADGLVDNVVSSLLEDREGHLWFGTWWSGVSRYDGEAFETFTTEDGLAHHSVSSMLEDRQGYLWFVTGGYYHIGGGGVSRYDGETFVTFTTDDGLASNRLSSILEDREGHLWFGTGGYAVEGEGVSRYDGETFETFTTDDGLAHNTVLSMLEDRVGNLWFGTAEGVSRYDGRRFERFTTANGLASNGVVSLLEDRVGNLWFGTIGGGVGRYDGKGFTTFTVEDGLANYQVPAMREDREGYMWFGTWSGVTRYDPAYFTTFTTNDGLPSNGVMSLLEDRQGDLWVGTWDGVTRYDGTRFVPVEELAGHNVWSMLEDRQGNLWFGGGRGKIIRYDGQRFTDFTREADLAPEFVMSLLEDREGNVWFGSEERGVRRYDGKAFVAFTTADGLADNTVECILEDRKGDLWFGTCYNGVSRFDGERFVTFTTADGLAHNAVGCMLEDQQGRPWVGTEGGVSRFDGEKFTNFTTNDGLVHNNVFDVLEDRNGHLWFGTFGGGVGRYDGRVFQTLSRQDGLAHDAVQQILQDRHGDFWIATEGGLTRYRPSRTLPGVRITEVIADRRYGPVEEIHLPASQSLIVFAFQGRSFTTPVDRMAYVYRLEGYDPNWQPVYTHRVAYEELPLGDYTFQVKAVDRDLNYSEPATIRIVVEPDPHLQALTEALSGSGPAGEFVGESPALRRVQTQLAQVAPAEVTVLILGETGTGKGLAARTVHGLSTRRSGPFTQVNCGSLPRDLVESELFGHERGAFTGAVARKLGKVELAKGGTLFLDEIGDMPLEGQVKLLRLLEEGTFERVGGTETLPADVRVVAATNRDLAQMVQEGQFREDLYYRLQVFEVPLPPLRERREDIPLLAAYFAGRMAAHLDKKVARLTPEALGVLQVFDWPGNVRELEHAVQRAVIVCPGAEIRAEDLGLDPGKTTRASAEALVTLEELERRYVGEVLEKTGWVITGDRGAAAILGLPPSTLRHRLKTLGIERPE